MFCGSPAETAWPHGDARLDDRAGERLVLGRLEHVRAEVVLVGQLVDRRLAEPRQLLRRLVQRVVVFLPALVVVLERLVELRGERALGCADGFGLGGAEAERERRGASAADHDARVLDDVPVGDVRVRAADRVVGRADEAARTVRELAVQGREDRLGVVAVRRVRRGVRVVRDEHRVAGRGVDRRGVAAAVPLPAAAVAVHRGVEAHVELVRRVLRDEGHMHEHRVAARVGQVVGDDPVLAALRGRRDPACHPAGVGQRLRRVRRVPRLQVGERRAVAHLVLQRLDVSVVDRRVVRVAEDAVRDRVPDLRGPVTRGAQAVLAREVEVREVAVRDRRADRQHVRRPVVAERDRRVVERDGERDVGAVQDAARAVVHVPALVDRDLGLVRTGWQSGGLERRGTVAVRILEPGAQAVGLPVARAAELGLEVPDRNRHRRAHAVRGPVGLVVVVELHRAAGRGERDVVAVRHRVEAVVLVPRVVERGLVLVGAGREVERPLPDVIARVVGQVRRRARRVPVARAAGLGLEVAGDRDGGGVGRARRGLRGQQNERRSHEREEQTPRHEREPTPIHSNRPAAYPKVKQ